MSDEKQAPMTLQHQDERDLAAVTAAVAFLRDAFRDDGAEGESFHLVCRVAERLLAVSVAQREQLTALEALLHRAERDVTRADVAAERALEREGRTQTRCAKLEAVLRALGHDPDEV